MDKDAMRSVVDEEIRKLIDANKHWDQVIVPQVSTASLTALQAMPRIRQMQEAAKGISDVVLELTNSDQICTGLITQHFEAMHVSQHLIEHFDKLTEQFVKAAPRIRKALESSSEIGHLGWTVTGEMEFPVMLHLSECSNAEAADAYMFKYYEREDPVLNGIQERLRGIDHLKSFSVGLDQSFTAFRNEQFALVIPFLILVLEHALRNLDSPRPFPSTDMTKTVKDSSKHLGKNERLAFAIKSLLTFTEDHYDKYDPRTDSKGRVRRKGIMHGLQVPPNEKIQAIRLYHVLDTVVQLYPPKNAS